MIFFLVLLSIATLATGQNTVGECSKKVEAIKNFNVAKYAGVWYETHRYEYVDELNMDCVTAEYTPNKTGPVGVHNMGVFNKTIYMIDGTAQLADATSTDGKLEVSFPVAPTPSPYWVLDTDYTNYAVVYSCTEKNGNNTVISWILSRHTVIDGKSMQKVSDVLAKNEVKWEHFRATSHTEEACNGSSLPTLAVAVSIISAFITKFF